MIDWKAAARRFRTRYRNHAFNYRELQREIVDVHLRHRIALEHCGELERELRNELAVMREGQIANQRASSALSMIRTLLDKHRRRQDGGLGKRGILEAINDAVEGK